MEVHLREKIMSRHDRTLNDPSFHNVDWKTVGTGPTKDDDTKSFIMMIG